MWDPRLCHYGYMETSADGDELPALYLGSFNAFNLATSLGRLHSLPKKEMTVQILKIKGPETHSVTCLI